jgi:YD repeat-containing protein
LRGNLTSDGSNTFGYSSENLLTSATVGGVATTLAYDPLLRLYQTASGTTARFAYDGLDRIAEYNGANALQRRYVFDGGGQPIVWYEGATVSSTTRRFLSSDERGSVIAAIGVFLDPLGNRTLAARSACALWLRSPSRPAAQ